MNQIAMCGIIAVFIVFQPEIRRRLKLLMRKGMFYPLPNQSEDNKMIQAFDKAIQYLSPRKMGAIITVERSSSLDKFIETGVSLDADITGELLINIFFPNTTLHDGAVIVRNDKIAAAGICLPLSKDKSILKEYGTRHRAAVGISEVSDAVTIIVSEETGEVSITMDNELKSNLTREEYLTILRDELIRDASSDLLAFQIIRPPSDS